MRLNIVLNKENVDLPGGVLLAKSFDEAFRLAEEHGAEKTFIIGGASVYAQAIQLPDCGEIFLTHVLGEFGCDTFFPAIDPTRFKKTFESEVHEERGVKFKFVKYEALRNL